MSEKRQPEQKPWEPDLEKPPGFNPFANDEIPDDEPELDLDELEDDTEEFSEKIKPDARP
jgi:hypothetical protein